MTDLPAPVEYGEAVERYLSEARLGEGSRRIYRVALHGWAWPLVGRPAPTGTARRGARPPVLPLALLDDPRTPARLSAALATRATTAVPRTLARELACLRAATAWWRARAWITADPAAGLAPPDTPPPEPRSGPAAPSAPPDRARAALGLRAPLRELTLWNLLHESGAPVERVLALDTDDLDLPRRRTCVGVRPQLAWGPGAARLLPLLLVGRTTGPLFLTARRAPEGTPAADQCPVTGRGRLSYRRSAELFTAATCPLDPAGRGWPLLALRRPRPAVSASGVRLVSFDLARGQSRDRGRCNDQ
ncbi:hypothetical protein ACFVT1_13315 [Streptomyces sp. NPDC057963]|uniref:hypothetical protein n=1 Tax=Streptomyces sp. NPDC057963 TaxID=3346290 RepID=UPI0036EAC7F9